MYKKYFNFILSSIFEVENCLLSSAWGLLHVISLQNVKKSELFVLGSGINTGGQ